MSVTGSGGNTRITKRGSIMASKKMKRLSLKQIDTELTNAEDAILEIDSRVMKLEQIIEPKKPESSFIPMILNCPLCHARHIDVGIFAVKPHHTHACQSCGHCWRPAIVNTCGVHFLPGFKDKP